MLVNICISILITAVILLVLWLLRGVMLTPVRRGAEQEITVVLSVTGESKELENTVDGVLWLIQNGTLPASLVIEDAGMDADTRRAAEALTKDKSLTLRERQA